MTAVAERPVALIMNETQPPEWRRVSKLTLAAVPTAVGCARLLVQHALTGWRIDKHDEAAIEQAVDALVSHAVETTGITDTLPVYSEAFDRLTLIKVRLILEPQRAIVEVWDSGSTPPLEKLCRHPAISASEDWGYDVPSRRRRVVWCALSTYFESSPETSTALPRRMSRQFPHQKGTLPARAMRDPEVLWRVLDGLRNLTDDTESGISDQEN